MTDVTEVTEVTVLDRQLDAWFAGEHPGAAPDRILLVSLAQVHASPQRHPLRWWLRSDRPSAARARQVAVFVLVLSTLAAALLVAGGSRREPTPLSTGADLVVLRQGQVIAIAPDGTERSLGQLTREMLGGEIQLIVNAAVSLDGHLAVRTIQDDDREAGVVVVDLHDLGAAPQVLDAEGMGFAFSGDGRLGMASPDGIATYDPSSGESRSSGLEAADGRLPYLPVMLGGGVQWTLDGSGILVESREPILDSSGHRIAGILGRLAIDGTFTAGMVPTLDTGLGPRRVSPSGELLRCRTESDEICGFQEGDLFAVSSDGARTVLRNPRPEMRLGDFAWAKDGGFWLLLESAGPGPRTVELVHVSTAKEVRTVARFPVRPEDEDPTYFSPAAYIAAIAPDDSRLALIVSASTDGRFRYLVDTSDGRVTAIDQIVAGWLPADFEP